MNKLSVSDVMSVLRHLVRVKGLFEIYRRAITNDCFLGSGVVADGYIGDDYGELPQLLIFNGLRLYYEEQYTSEVPSRSMLETYTREYIRREGIYVGDELIEQMFDDPDPSSGYLSYLYDESSECNTLTGQPIIKAFLTERVVNSRLQGLMTFDRQEKGTVTERLSALADKAQEIQNLGNTYQVMPTFQEQAFFDALPDRPHERSTGIPWLDESLGGHGDSLGQRPGECYALVGCSGAGKTTLLTEWAVQNALQAAAYARNTGTAEEKVLYYTFEQPTHEILTKMISCGANIDRMYCEISNRAREGILDPSTCRENAKQYELEVWPDEDTREYEWQRFQNFKRLIGQSLIIRNFSGKPDLFDVTPEQKSLKRSLGRQGVNSVLEDALRIEDQYGCGIRAIYVDHLAVMCGRQCGGDTEQYYRLLKTVGDEVSVKLAGRLTCSVYVAHQISGVGNSRSPLAKPTLADAEGCRSLANDMEACWTLGVPDKSGNEGARVWLKAVKERHAGSTAAGSGIILQHDPHFSRMNDVTHLFREDRAAHCFRRIEEATLY